MLILTPYLGIEMAAKALNGKAIVALQGLYWQKSTTPWLWIDSYTVALGHWCIASCISNHMLLHCPICHCWPQRNVHLKGIDPGRHHSILLLHKQSKWNKMEGKDNRRDHQSARLGPLISLEKWFDNWRVENFLLLNLSKSIMSTLWLP